METKTRGRPRKTVEPPDRIANGLIERMFFIAAEDDEMSTYYRLLETPIRGHGLATSYASKKVARTFTSLMAEKTGLDYADLES
jgi:hypothetical protein